MTIKSLALLFTVCSAEVAGAFTYSEGDLLLVFRKDTFKDFEYNIGSISNYLGHPAGTVIPVSNWDVNLVRTNFNSTNLANVKFLVVAATAIDDPVRRAWMTDANADDTPSDVSGSKMSSLHSKILFTGQQAESFTATNSQAYYQISAGDPSSYTAIVSDGGRLDATTMGGAAPFPVESENPATNRFFEIKISNLPVKPAALQIGSFSLTSAGDLTFTAGAAQQALLQPQIVSSGRVGGEESISFTTMTGANYRLRYTTILAGSVPTWTELPIIIPGDGSTKTLTDTSTDAQRFYAVEAFR